MQAVSKNFLIDNRWAFAAIIIGTLVGFTSAVLCVAFHLIIFGFNIMYIVSPLSAGVIETLIARRKYGKSTGAISALITFILINAYGWLFPKDPITLSLITIIALGLMLDAAFPTLVRYILFVVGVGTLTRVIGFIVKRPSEILEESVEADANTGPSADEIFLDELTIPILSIPHIKGGKIKEYVGLVFGEAIAKEKESKGRISKLAKMVKPTLLDDMNLGDARKEALSRMLENANRMGANRVIEVSIDYNSMGGLQGSALIVTASGTAIITE